MTLYQEILGLGNRQRMESALAKIHKLNIYLLWKSNEKAILADIWEKGFYCIPSHIPYEWVAFDFNAKPVRVGKTQEGNYVIGHEDSLFVEVAPEEPPQAQDLLKDFCERYRYLYSWVYRRYNEESDAEVPGFLHPLIPLIRHANYKGSPDLLSAADDIPF